jgi:hypothetical protein
LAGLFLEKQQNKERGTGQTKVPGTTKKSKFDSLFEISCLVFRTFALSMVVTISRMYLVWEFRVCIEVVPLTR